MRSNDDPCGYSEVFKVTSDRLGPVLIEPNQSLYDKHRVLAMNGVVDADPDRPIRIVLANYGTVPVRLRRGQNVAYTASQPTVLYRSPVMLTDIFGQDFQKEDKDDTFVDKKDRGPTKTLLETDETIKVTDDNDLAAAKLP